MPGRSAPSPTPPAFARCAYPEKDYFTDKINNNIADYNTEYVNGNFPSIHLLEGSVHHEFPNGNFDANVPCY